MAEQTTYDGSDKWQLYEHDKINLFPPVFNELREVLHRDFPTLWSIVGGMMLHDQERFIEAMNGALDCNVSALRPLDEGCQTWLTKLLMLRNSGQSGIILADRATQLFYEQGKINGVQQ